MKTLYDLCKPRESVFDEKKRDDVLDLTNLQDDSINPDEFLEENFVTEGMNLLIDIAFKRFRRQGSSGLVRLTQAMGGGKTHNMVVLGLLAKHPEYFEKVTGKKLPSDIEDIRVVTFTGRESDAPFGIWGSIAEQLGKKDVFKDYYSPLAAPGQTAWTNLLEGSPVLILIDELPPYLENARSKTVGNSDLAVVTTNALANLFTALGKEELSNVCLVISDLKATYESGSELLQSVFKDLDNEMSRSAQNIEPVGSTSDEVYQILKKRLFSEVPEDNSGDVNEIANAYKESVGDAKQMNYTNMSADSVYVGIKDSFPFHPSIKDLYARFKENPGFQQTRGLIRMMRVIVAQLFDGDTPKAQERYLVNVYDFDLNQKDMLSLITQIKPSLTNAISHDIAAGGRAVAEVVDRENNETAMQDLSKILLVASLADVPNALLGLSESESIGYLCAPNRDITKIKKALSDFIMKSWYLYSDRDNRLFFKNTKNMIAQMNSLVESYDNESAKKELRTFLEDKFKPSLNDCYQKIEVFPAVDEINLVEDKITLVLFEPYPQGKLHPDLADFYENARFKNRIMFLSGQRNTMDKLYESAKKRKAIKSIIDGMQEEKVAENNPQYVKALETLDKVTLSILQAARETFMSLLYPSRDGLRSADFLMEFQGNNYVGETQIKAVLTQKQKFTTEVTGDNFRAKCEDRLFTQKEMRWRDIKERAATNSSWQWHIPSALDALRTEMLSKEVWKENGDYVEKGPFALEDTDIHIQEIARNQETGEVTLKLVPKFGDTVCYEVGAEATSASKKVDTPNEFKTSELVLSFICIDSTGEHNTGKARAWKNKVELKYQLYDKGEEKMVVLRAAPPVKIKYTTDGSNPKDGGSYDGEFPVPEGCSYVLAIAEN